MDTLVEKSEQKINWVSTDFSRSLMDNISWGQRLIAIRGARGVGKTTLLLQYLKKHVPEPDRRLYVSLDSLWFTENTLSHLADSFVKRGGRHLFLDEVHKYPNWSREIKNLYDDYPKLQIVFTGSSLLEILNARADLSRRSVNYELQGLSYREYLQLVHGHCFPVYSLKEIIENQQSIARKVLQQLKPIKFFSDYLQCGYYPFFMESQNLYLPKVEEIINFIIEVELPLQRQVEVAYVHKIKQLLQVIAESVPFIPNVSKLSRKIQINRNTLVTYLQYLDESHITTNLYKEARGISRLQKPDKIYLENTNILYALAQGNTQLGHVRETFFLNQVKKDHIIQYTSRGNFIVDQKYTLEVGGKNKGASQITGLEHAFIAADDIEIGSTKRIPLWLFGFLY